MIGKYLTYEVFIIDKNKKEMGQLGAGLNAVVKFYELAEKGIEGANKTELEWGCNVNVEISGKELRRFVYKYYRDAALHNLDPDEIYTIIGWDMG